MLLAYTNYTSLKNLPGTSTLAQSASASVMKSSKFDNIDTSGQRYKLFSWSLTKRQKKLGVHVPGKTSESSLMFVKRDRANSKGAPYRCSPLGYGQDIRQAILCKRSSLAGLCYRVAEENKVNNFDTYGQCYKTFFPSSLMTRPNKLEGLSLETQSGLRICGQGQSQPNWSTFQMLPSWVRSWCYQQMLRQDWKVIARYKHQLI